ncbi:MAG: hypothetical protein ACOYEE_05985, partial [Christensenellales bacterium]
NCNSFSTQIICNIVRITPQAICNIFYALIGAVLFDSINFSYLSFEKLACKPELPKSVSTLTHGLS